MGFFAWLDPKPKRSKPATKFDRSLAETRAMRGDVKKEFLPLFDHLINLACDSHKRGYYKRAGRELRQARKVARY